MKKKQTSKAAAAPVYNMISPTTIVAKASDDSRSSRASQRGKADPITAELTRFKNIKEFKCPYTIKGETIDIREMVDVCQKAYFGVKVIGNIVDIMCEFANTEIYFEGGNKKSRDVMEAWAEKIQLWSLKEKFFREFFRSGNVLMQRFDATITDADMAKMTQVFGLNRTAASKKKIPVRYIILNPADIRIITAISYNFPVYYKMLNRFELGKLQKPTTQMEKDFLSSLPKVAQESIKKGLLPMIPLEKDMTYTVFYKKQDYEPFAVPFFYGVLDDIELKLEFKKMDRAIAHTADWAILLLTAGSEAGINPKTLEALNQLFTKEELKRVLVSDYTTKGQWLIPDISKILGKEKYAQVNEDILQGLNAALFDSTEKFANQSVKVQVFLERLKEAQKAFMNEFFQPEVKRVCKELGFKDYPRAKFQDRSFKDELEYNKLYVRMAESGLLTPEELNVSLESGQLPLKEDSVQSQTEFKTLKDKGLYAPLLNQKQEAPGGENGRPSGAKAPQSKKKMSPIGASFDLAKVQEILKASNNLLNQVEDEHKKKFKIKELNETQKNACHIFAKLIMVNEPIAEWSSRVKTYIKEPKKMEDTVASDIDQIKEEYEIEDMLASILYLSRVEKDDKSV